MVHSIKNFQTKCVGKPLSPSTTLLWPSTLIRVSGVRKPWQGGFLGVLGLGHIWVPKLLIWIWGTSRPNIKHRVPPLPPHIVKYFLDSVWINRYRVPYGLWLLIPSNFIPQGTFLAFWFCDWFSRSFALRKLIKSSSKNRS